MDDLNVRRVVIMTALDVEYMACRAFLTGVTAWVHPAGTVYEVGSFESDGASWTVALAEMGTGNPIAGIETGRALDTFRPQLALFVGVAGGVKDVAVGDVVAADYIYDYEPSKVTDVSQPRIKTFGSGYPLVQRARVIRRGEEWHKRITSGATPSAFVGPIASGEQVIAGGTTPTHKLLESHCGDALAVEMEGWGFMFGAHTNGDIPAMVIRGISDLTISKDSAHDLREQPLAAENAAAFAFELLATIDPPSAHRIEPIQLWSPAPADLFGPEPTAAG